MFISAAITRTIVAVTQQAGVTPRHLLASAQLPAELLDDPARLLSITDFDRLVRTAIALARDPALGLHVGEQAPLAMLHVVGHILTSCASLRDAFHIFLRFLPLIEPDARYQLRESGATAQFSYRPAASPDADLWRFHAECCLVFTFRLARNMLTTQQPPATVRFAFSAPAYAVEYTRVFGVTPSFDAPDNVIEFPRGVLDQALVHADPGAFAALKVHADELLRRRSPERDTAARVAEMLRYERDLANLDESAIARRLHLAPRTLRRRLAAQGHPFLRLLDEARRARACADLALPGACAKVVSESLGFSEPSALRRAFKRWTGMTIGEYAKVAAPGRLAPGAGPATDEQRVEAGVHAEGDA